MTEPGPLRAYRAPAYPTRREALERPGLLRRPPAPSWLADGVAGVASLVMVAGSAGCTRGVPPEQLAIVAPIFEHGAGRASSGCVVVSPPVFVSEEEAAQIISEELAKAHIVVSQKNVEWKNVRVPFEVATPSSGRTKSDASRPVPLRLDGVDPVHKVAFKYVSSEGAFDLGVPRPDSTAKHLDTKQGARNLRATVGRARTQRVHLGVFYDPLEIPPIDVDRCRMEQAENRLTAEKAGQPPAESPCVKESQTALSSSKQNLRLQVRDFVDWLKAQGAL